MKELLLVCIGSFFGGGARYLRGAILSLILVLAYTASSAQQTETSAKGKVADPDSLAAWYEKTLQLSGITVTGRAADKKVTVEKTSINPSASVTAATGSVLEVLRSSSAVTVDGSGQVSIRGNGNVLILVDGVPSQRTEHRHRDQS